LAIKYLAGERLIGTAAERTALETTALDSVPQDSWKEIGRFTVTGSATNSFVVRGLSSTTSGDMALKDNLMVLLHTEDSNNSGVRSRIQFNVTTEGTTGKYSDFSAYFSESDCGDQSMETCYIRNTDDFVKLFNGESVRTQTSGATNNASRYVFGGKWNSTDQITKIHIQAHSGSYTFGVGTECIVLGCDDDEATGGDVFWDELATTTPLTSNTSDITATFTGKKWMMIQAFMNGSGTARTTLRINGVSSSNSYGDRLSTDGAVDDSWSTRTYIRFGANSPNSDRDMFSRAFLCKYTGKNALVHCVGMDDGGSGSSGRPKFLESAGKNNSTDAIASLTIHNNESGAFETGSFFRVWGHD